MDLTRLGQIKLGSIFASDYEERAARLAFLRGFHDIIVRPIQPHEEILEYVPTQAVAEYVANVLELDGIVYGSAQLGTVEEPDAATEGDGGTNTRSNVVLFGGATVVRTADDDKSTVHGAQREQAARGESLDLVRSKVHAVRIQSVQFESQRLYDLKWPPTRSTDDFDVLLEP